MHTATRDPENFPQVPVIFLSKVIAGELKTSKSFWLPFEQKVLFKSGELAFSQDSDQQEKQLVLAVYCFFVCKVLAARLVLAQSSPEMFRGVPKEELPFLRLSGLTLISLLTDVVIELFEEDLRNQLLKGIASVKQRLFDMLLPIEDKQLGYNQFSLKDWP